RTAEVHPVKAFKRVAELRWAGKGYPFSGDTKSEDSTIAADIGPAFLEPDLTADRARADDRAELVFQRVLGIVGMRTAVLLRGDKRLIVRAYKDLDRRRRTPGQSDSNVITTVVIG